jgi:hypothetical protein
MQIFRSIPTDTNILKRDGKILKAAYAGITLAVLWSIYTEYNFIQSVASENLNTFLPYWLDSILHFILSVFLISIIEGTGLVMLAYAIDSILKKEVRTNLINFIAACLLVVVCYSFTVGVSLFGVKKVSNNWIESPKMENTNYVDSLLSIEKQAIQQTFSNDSTLIATNWNNLITAKENDFNGQIAKLQTSINNYFRKEKRTGKSYVSSKNYLQGKIESLNSKQAQEVGTLQVAAGSELKQLIASRKADAGAANNKASNEKSKIVSSNTDKSNNYKSELSSTSNMIQYGIYISLPILLFCMVVIRNIFNKAGIKDEMQVDDFFYMESPLQRFKNLIRLKWLTFAHSKLDNRFAKIKPLEHKPAINEIYDRTDLTKYIKPLELSETQQNLEVFRAVHSIENGNGGTVNNDTKTAVNSNPTPSVGNNIGTVECKKIDCKKRFDNYPKTKKFCSKKCRMSHHKFELKKH